MRKQNKKTGAKKKITDALLCGDYGQIFGSEKQCMKYYAVWKDIFPLLFESASIVNKYPIIEYESTFDLVNILMKKHDDLDKK